MFLFLSEIYLFILSHVKPLFSREMKGLGEKISLPVAETEGNRCLRATRVVQ